MLTSSIWRRRAKATYKRISKVDLKFNTDYIKPDAVDLITRARLSPSSFPRLSLIVSVCSSFATTQKSASHFPKLRRTPGSRSSSRDAPRRARPLALRGGPAASPSISSEYRIRWSGMDRCQRLWGKEIRRPASGGLERPIRAKALARSFLIRGGGGGKDEVYYCKS